MKALLIGGAADGRVLDVPPRDSELEVPVAPDPYTFWYTSRDLHESLLRRQTYRRRTDLEAQPASVVAVFTPQGEPR